MLLPVSPTYTDGGSPVVLISLLPLASGLHREQKFSYTADTLVHGILVSDSWLQGTHSSPLPHWSPSHNPPWLNLFLKDAPALSTTFTLNPSVGANLDTMLLRRLASEVLFPVPPDLEPGTAGC